jgi:hypothetical protein
MWRYQDPGLSAQHRNLIYLTKNEPGPTGQWYVIEGVRNCVQVGFEYASPTFSGCTWGVILPFAIIRLTSFRVGRQMPGMSWAGSKRRAWGLSTCVTRQSPIFKLRTALILVVLDLKVPSYSNLNFETHSPLARLELGAGPLAAFQPRHRHVVPTRFPTPLVFALINGQPPVYSFIQTPSPATNISARSIYDIVTSLYHLDLTNRIVKIQGQYAEGGRLGDVYKCQLKSSSGTTEV